MNITRNYLIHTKDGNKILTAAEIIENAKQQEREGIEPHYFWRYAKEEETPRGGWLVWSTWADGCGVVFKLNDDNYMILDGWQADFIYN